MTTIDFTFDHLWEEYEASLNSLFYRYGNRLHGYGATYEDVKHEMVCWLLGRERKFARKHEELGDPDAFGRYLYRSVENALRDYSVRLREQSGGQDRATAAYYSAADLRTLLPSMFDRDAWVNPPQIVENGTQGRSTRSLAEGNNWVTTLADISRAFEALPEEDQDLLRRFHQQDEKNVDLAQERGVSEQMMSWAHTKILNKMVDFLGGPRPSALAPDPIDVWHGRKTLGNQQARSITSSFYDGEN